MNEQPKTYLLSLKPEIGRGLAMRQATIDHATRDYSSYLQGILEAKDVDLSKVIQEVRGEQGLVIGILISGEDPSKAENATVPAADTAPNGEPPDQSPGPPKTLNTKRLSDALA